MTMPKILMAPTSFKGSLRADEAASILHAALCEAGFSPAHLEKCPVADGGNDTLAVLALSDPGFERHKVSVTGPLPSQQVEAEFLIHTRKLLAVVESAEAHGLLKMPPERPLAATETTSYGVGQLIREAFDVLLRRSSPEAEKTIVVTLGGSASTDGGAGALQALGMAFLDKTRYDIFKPIAGRNLSRIRFAVPPTHWHFGNSHFWIATDVNNPLTGPNGAAAVYGPQKGATPENVRFLDGELSHLADVLARATGQDFRHTPGAGAAGGLGFGLSYLPQSRIVSGMDWMAEQLDFKTRLEKSDLIVTGEGRLDASSLSGKVIGQLLRWAGKRPVFAFCGSVDEAAVKAYPTLHAFPLATTEAEKAHAMAYPEEALRQAVLKALPLLKKTLSS